MPEVQDTDYVVWIRQSALNLTVEEDATDPVKFDNVWKSYGSTSVLRGIDVSVRRGSIYGLLGPSGCGKTTLLRCIVGRVSSDSGSVTVFGHRPGSREAGIPGPKVGYMPQDLALFQELTIGETLRYFGYVYHMSISKIIFRTEFLLQLLNLPTEWKLIKNLSGGQQRRVSFSIALLHEPPLLILDEPTVGVDPLLRKSIWQHLLEISRTGNTTVMITTHYIEEARHANRVGLMRNGKLLAEADPEMLLTEHELPTLEDVFLKLCSKDDEGLGTDQSPTKGKNTLKNVGLNIIAKFKPKESRLSFSETNKLNLDDETVELPYHPKKKENASYWDFCPNKDMMNALVVKNMRKMSRQPGMMLFHFMLPSIQIILFCWTLGGDPKHLNIAVCNKDEGGYGKELGKLFLSHVNTEYVNQIMVDDEETALNMVIEGDAWGTITIAPRYSQDLIYRFLNPTKDVSDDIIKESTIHIRLDMTDQQIGYTLQRIFVIAFKDFEIDALRNTSMKSRLPGLPVKFGEPVYGEPDPNFREFFTPGVFLVICYFMAVALTTLAFILERKQGLLDRSYVAGVKTIEIILSHVISQFGVMVIQVALQLVFALIVFQLPSKGPIVVVVLICLLQGMAGMTFGFLISAVCDSEDTAALLAVGSLFPTVLISGIFWPLEAMPVALQHFSVLLPQTLPVLSLRSVLSRGRSITFKPVWLGFISSIAWTIIFLIVSVVLMRIKRH